MLNDEMIQALNVQVNKEIYSAYLYLSMAAYFTSTNLKGFANWMQIQAQEEMTHAMKIYDYILGHGARVKLLPIEAPPNDWKNPLAVFKLTYEHEQKVTQMINNLVALAIKLNDYATHSFLQWFVTEQVEEEASAAELMEKLQLAGDTSALLFLDAELAKRQFTTITEG